MLTQALDNHSKFPSYGILGWDFTVDNNDTVICLEYNARIPGIVQSQALLGPVFQIKGGTGIPLKDEILEIYEQNKKRKKKHNLGII